MSEDSCTETTIQGVPVTLVKYRNQTDFTFKPTGQAGEISQAELIAAYGSQDPDFVYGLMHRLANASSKGRSPDDEGLKFALASVRGMTPRDPFEAQICAVMAVVLSSMMKCANRRDHAEEPAEIESAERSINRFARTYASLVEAFDRHRNGDQKIAVQQISVAEGAQAIVGDVHQNGAKAPGKANGHAST
jgi:hypothetical protein